MSVHGNRALVFSEYSMIGFLSALCIGYWPHSFEVKHELRDNIN